MTNQDFFSGTSSRDHSVRVESRGRVIVPEHHVRNIHAVFGSATVINQPIQTPHVTTVNQPKTHTVESITHKKPEKPATHHIPTHRSVPARIDGIVPPAAIKPASKSIVQPKRAPKIDHVASHKAPHKSHVRHQTGDKSSLTSKVLASAAETMPTTAESGGASTLIDAGGAGAIANESAEQTWMRHLNSKVTFEVRIDHRKVGRFLKYLIVTSLVVVSAYLAWDTWFTNKPISYIFSQAVGAVSIDDTNPFSVDPTTVSNQAWAAHTAPADQARYLYLPSIGIQSRVDSVGINSNGNIDSPKNANDVAWYDGSAKPGQDGQVFINGHKSYSSSYNSAFDKLDQLKVGDSIVIENGNGDKFTYKVVSNQTLATDKVDMNQALNVPDDAKQGVTLMTYAGKYNYRDQSTDQRVVVYAARQ